MADAEPAVVTPAEATPGDNRIKLSACAEYQLYSCVEQTCWATASFKAPFYEPTSRPSVDIVAVIDKSGSMSGVKLDLVKETLLFVIDQLKECDRMSLVTYDTYVQLVFGLTKMDKANKERSKSFVQSIVDGSSTNLSGGLLKGMEQIGLTHGGEKAQVQSVLLLTDGLANQGITSKGGILAEMKKMQEQGLQAVAIPSNPPPNPPQQQRSGLHALFGGRNRRQRQTPQLQQQQVAPPPPPQAQQQQVAPPPPPPQAQQQQVAPPPPPPQAQQQQVAPPPPPQAQQQQVAPPPPPQAQQQQVAPPPPPPQAQQQQVAPPPPPQAQQQQVGPPPPPQAQQQQVAPPPPPQAQQQQVGPPPPPPPPVQQQQAPLLLLADDSPQAKPIPSGAKFDGTVYTFGFGSDHDATLLEAISTQGGGVYYYIDSNEKIPESFADCLGGLLSVMGQNLSFKLEAVGKNSLKTVHANRTVNWTTPNESCDIPMGDLQSEEERDIVLEIQLPAVPSPQQDTVVRTTLSYFNVITSELDTIQSELIISRGDGDKGPANRSVDIQKNRILATAALRESEPLADQGKLQDAQKVLKDAIATIEQSLTAKDTFCQALISDLKKSLESMKSRQAYLGHGKLYMQSKMQAHSVQRSNFVDSNSYYQNASKVAFRMKAKK